MCLPRGGVQFADVNGDDCRRFIDAFHGNCDAFYAALIGVQRRRGVNLADV
jgi:hypothetical protein